MGLPGAPQIRLDTKKTAKVKERKVEEIANVEQELVASSDESEGDVAETTRGGSLSAESPPISDDEVDSVSGVDSDNDSGGPERPIVSPVHIQA